MPQPVPSQPDVTTPTDPTEPRDGLASAENVLSISVASAALKGKKHVKNPRPKHQVCYLFVNAYAEYVPVIY